MDLHVPRGAVTVGYDGSDPSDKALRWAVGLAELDRRPVFLVHAYEQLPWVYSPTGVVLTPLEVREVTQKQAEETIEKGRLAAQDLAPDLEVSVAVSSLDARDLLAAAAPQSSLLVVGARGHSRMTDLLIGSVSAWISRHAPCPVVVVRPASPERAQQRIVVGADGTAVSAAALEFAFAQASLRALPLTVAHCFSEPFAGGYGLTGLPDEDLEGLPSERLAVAESVAGLKEKYVDVEVDVQLGRGPATAYLTRASEDASLVVVGSRRRTGVASVVSRSVSRTVVEHAACTVAVVPSSVAREE